MCKWTLRLPNTSLLPRRASSWYQGKWCLPGWWLLFVSVNPWQEEPGMPGRRPQLKVQWDFFAESSIGSIPSLWTEILNPQSPEVYRQEALIPKGNQWEIWYSLGHSCFHSLVSKSMYLLRSQPCLVAVDCISAQSHSRMNLPPDSIAFWWTRG